MIKHVRKKEGRGIKTKTRKRGAERELENDTISGPDF
jgi:hypothetical protein